MDHDAYLTGIAELYAAEVLGEGLASRWLELSPTRIRNTKLALVLQLESEAKVRLRPLLRDMPDLVEDQRQTVCRAPWRDKFRRPCPGRKAIWLTSCGSGGARISSGSSAVAVAARGCATGELHGRE